MRCDDLESLRKALWPSQIKAPMGQGQFGSHHPQTPLLILFSSYAFAPFREMSSLSRQPTIFLQSELTEDLISEPFWIDSVINSALHQDTSHLFEGVTATLDCSPAFPTDHLLPSFEDDHLGPPPATSDGAEPVRSMDFPVSGYNVPFSVQPGDLYAVFSLYPIPPITTTNCTPIPHHVAWTPHIYQLIANCFIMGITLVRRRKLPLCTRPHRQHLPHATSPLSPRHSPQPTWCLR